MHLHVFVEDVDDDRRKEAVAHVRDGDGGPRVQVAIQQPDARKAREAAAACIAAGLALARELESDDEVQKLVREYEALPVPA